MINGALKQQVDTIAQVATVVTNSFPTFTAIEALQRHAQATAYAESTYGPILRSRAEDLQRTIDNLRDPFGR